MKNKYRCLALFSGGLDSILAVKHMEKLGYKVLACFFQTPFFEADTAIMAAKENEIELTVVDVLPEYLEILINPRYGYGKNFNPCIDCHGFMFKTAAEMLDKSGADFLISGEVLGQRPMSQRRDAMNAVAKLSGSRDLIVRPLSQKLLTDTLPVREGWVKKDDMLDIQGRGRQRQLELACEYGIMEFHSPGGGCKLTEIKYSRKLRDLVDHDQLNEKNIRFLKYGRHFRLNESTKLVVGRNKSENEHISVLADNETVLKTVDWQGPLGILNKKDQLLPEEIKLAAAIVLRYNNNADQQAKVAWGVNFSLNNILCVEKYPPESVDDLMIK